MTSDDTSVLTIEPPQLVATQNVSKNQRVNVTATYTFNGSTYSTRRNVTVANATVTNMKILPTGARLSAVAIRETPSAAVAGAPALASVIGSTRASGSCN